MTREEAKHRLLSIERCTPIHTREDARDFEALEMAIQALSQEPCTVSVSEKEPNEITEEVTLRFFKNSLKVRWRDFVIYNVEWLKKNWQMEMDIVCGVEPCDDAISRETVIDTLQYAWETNKDIQESIVEIKALPSVTPSRRKGHWKKIETPQGYCDKYVCSVCGYEIDTSQDEIDEYNYCPNCGAKMVEPQESGE